DGRSQGSEIKTTKSFQSCSSFGSWSPTDSYCLLSSVFSLLELAMNGSNYGMPSWVLCQQAHAYNRHGSALALAGQVGESDAYIREAIRLAPDYMEPQNNLDNVLMFQEKFDEAVTCYESALRLSADNPDIYNNLGHVLSKQGKLDKAITYFQKALQLRPEFSEALNNMGIAVQWRGDWGQAEKCYRQALRLRPDFADAWNNLANMLRLQRKLD